MNGTTIRRTLGLGTGMVALTATLLSGTAHADPSRANISVGSGNYWGVVCAQRAINAMHYENTAWYHEVAEDGVFGSDTYNGVRSFQHYMNYHRNQNLVIDGIVGPATGDDVVYMARHWNASSNCYPYVPTTY
ncbi:peptidoglycan-binding protein [Streptomyces mirabilis]|uniref:peptidoglycan-binding domain-containing protein n=1 Tax=Streptomyces mirabilis TaxID=68239 RepID=UPI0036AFA532